MTLSRFKDAAVFAGAGLLGLGTGLPVRDFADAALALGDDGAGGGFTAAVTHGVAAADTLAARFEGDAAPLIATVREVAMTHRMGLREAYALEAASVRAHGGAVDGYAVADALMTRAAKLLVGRAPSENQLVRDALAAIYHAYLRDPSSVEAMMPDVAATLFALDDRLTALDAHVREALRMLRTDLLLSDGRRILPPWQGPDSWLLRAEYGVTPFHPARADALEAISAWSEGPDRLSVQLLYGRGGAGKTRLALETVAHHRRRGWRAGFLGRYEGEGLRPALTPLFDGEQSVLLVVDYAETRREELVPLIEEAAGFLGKRCRLLLVARAKAEWWDVLCRSSAAVGRVMGALASSYELGPLSAETTVRESLYRQAATAYGHALDVQNPPRPDIDLSGDAFALPLNVHLAALSGVRGRVLESGDELLADVVTRERRFWDRRIDSLGLDVERHGALVSQAVALVTLVGGCRHRARVRELIASAPLAAGLQAVDVAAIARLICELYPSPEDLGALRPDLLGEELVALELAEEPALYDRAMHA